MGYENEMGRGKVSPEDHKKVAPEEIIDLKSELREISGKASGFRSLINEFFPTIRNLRTHAEEGFRSYEVIGLKYLNDKVEFYREGLWEKMDAYIYQGKEGLEFFRDIALHICKRLVRENKWNLDVVDKKDNVGGVVVHHIVISWE